MSRASPERTGAVVRRVPGHGPKAGPGIGNTPNGGQIDMTVPTNPDRNAIARAARDPFSRRKFLALTGGTGAAGAFLAACGDDEDDESTTGSETSTDMETSSDPLADFGEG